MDFATAIMIVLAAALMATAYLRGDSSLEVGLKDAGRTLVGILPLLIAAFVVAGLAQVLVPKEVIANWLGRDSGLKGIFIAAGVGAITPGGPFVSFPLVASLYKSGAGIGPAVGALAGLWLGATMLGAVYTHIIRVKDRSWPAPGVLLLLSLAVVVLHWPVLVAGLG